VADRDRKRQEKRKRKQRSSERREERASRSEERNRVVRETLAPLQPEERPGVVTAGAVISILLALSVLGLYLSGEKVGVFDAYGNKTGEQQPSIIAALVPIGVMGLMAWGMWRVRYWAVLGFQALMALLMIATILNIVAATSILDVVANGVVLGVAGYLFYKMVKALARIQMPNR
jgi:Na+/H+-dicarboxylate symporter